MTNPYFHINFSADEHTLRVLFESLSQSTKEWEQEIGLFGAFLLDPSRMDFPFQTSGTTGIPKTIFFSKPQIQGSAKMTNDYVGMLPGNTAFLGLPAKYVAGRMMIARAWERKLNLVCIEPSLYYPLTTLQTPVDLIALTPAQVNTMLETEGTGIFAFCRTILIGGGLLNAQTEAILASARINAYCTYGMTETLTHIAMRKVGDEVYQTLSDHILITTDERECLSVIVPHISTTPILTNDIIQQVSEREFYWLGRQDDIINAGGLKVFPAAIEAVLATTPELSGKVFYVGKAKDTTFGEVPVLVIEGAFVKVDLTQLNSLLKTGEKIKHIHFLPVFERTGSGKIKKRIF